MAISLEIPKGLQMLQQQSHQVAQEVLRPISRKYDLAEHEYPKELDMLAALIDGMNDSGSGGGASAAGGNGAPDSKKAEPAKTDEPGVTKNGANMAGVIAVSEMCWGDVGLLLTMPRQGLGNSAI